MDKEQVREISTNKKRNVRYWDGIDSIVTNAIEDIAESSVTPINLDELECHIDELTSDVRELIIKELENLGGKFPFVDENY